MKICSEEFVGRKRQSSEGVIVHLRSGLTDIMVRPSSIASNNPFKFDYSNQLLLFFSGQLINQLSVRLKPDIKLWLRLISQRSTIMSQRTNTQADVYCHKFKRKQLSCPSHIIYPVMTFTLDTFSHYSLSENHQYFQTRQGFFFLQIGSCTRHLS